MTSLDKYLEIIKKGFSERENLMAMEPLHSIEEIAPLLDEKLTYKEFIDINRLLRQKYIVENPEDMLKDVDVYSEVTGKPLQDRLYRYMDDANLSISEMEPYFAYYPDKLYKNLVETRVIYKDMEEEILLEKKKRDGL